MLDARKSAILQALVEEHVRTGEPVSSTAILETSGLGVSSATVRNELVRLAIPRRVYTQAHMDVTAEAVIDVLENPEAVGGLQFTYEPESLRFFQARFEPVG